MLKRKPQLFIFFSILFLFGCSSYPDTPEGVVKQYVEFVSSGNCEEALELCSGDARAILKAQIDNGCEPYETTIDSLNCKIQDSTCECQCYESHSIYGQIKFPYYLTLVDEKWKLNAYWKESYESSLN